MSSETTLKRTLNYPLLTFYWLGSIVGAGIYVLAGQAGTSMGLSQVTGSATATCSCLSMAIGFVSLLAARHRRQKIHTR